MSAPATPLLNRIIVPLLALIIILFTFGLLTVCIFVKIEIEQKDIVLYVLGALTTMSAGVTGYYFGSTVNRGKAETVDKPIEK